MEPQGSPKRPQGPPPRPPKQAFGLFFWSPSQFANLVNSLQKAAYSWGRPLPKASRNPWDLERPPNDPLGPPKYLQGHPKDSPGPPKDPPRTSKDLLMTPKDHPRNSKGEPRACTQRVSWANPLEKPPDRFVNKHALQLQHAGSALSVIRDAPRPLVSGRVDTGLQFSVYNIYI